MGFTRQNHHQRRGGENPIKWIADNDEPTNDECKDIEKFREKYSDQFDRIQQLKGSCMLLKTRQREVYDSISKLSKSIYNLLSIDQLNYLSSVASLTQSGLEKLYNITTWGLKHEKDMEPYRSQISDVYSKLSNDQKNSTEGLAIKEILNPRVLLTIGDTLPPDILKDLEGNSHQFSEYLGKYVILDFWSTGCGGCMQMSAHLDRKSVV